MLKVCQFHILHNYPTKEMQEEPEGRRRRSTSTCERDGKKRMFSILFSWFFSSKTGEKSTKDQVLKPMYEIVSDVASELMEATVESIEEGSIDQKLNGARNVRQSQPQQKGTRRSRFLRRVMNLFKKSRVSTTSSTGLAARLNETACDDSEVDSRPETPGKMSWKRSVSLQGQVHRIKRPPFLSFAKRMKRYDSTSSISGMESTFSSVQFHLDESNSDSDDTSSLQPTSLGVTFAHPVYTSKCRSLAAEEKRPDTTNLLWKIMKADIPGADEYNFQPSKAFVESTIAEGSSNVRSLSLYPSDEEKDREDKNLYYGSFDSDDIPFDEIFTDASFFDMGQI